MNKENRTTLISTGLFSCLCFLSVAGFYFSWLYRLLDFIEAAKTDWFMEVFSYIFQAIGIFIMLLVIKKKKELISNHLFYPSVVLLSVLLSFLLFYAKSFSALVILGFIECILTGMVQGFYFYFLSAYLERRFQCITLGVASGISSLLNAVFASLDGGTFTASVKAVYLYSFLLVITICLWFIIIRTKRQDTEIVNISHCRTVNRKQLIFAGLMIFMFWCLSSLGFYFPIYGTVTTGINYEVLRITSFIGVIVAGFINKEDKRNGLICCLACMAFPFLSLALQMYSGPLAVLYFLNYIFTGFLSIYRFGLFADISNMKDENNNLLTYACVIGLIFGRFGEATGAALGISFAQYPIVNLFLITSLFILCIVIFMLHYTSFFTITAKEAKTPEEKSTSFRSIYDLSTREFEVLSLLVNDLSNREIADQLFISENTVRFHVSNLLKKTNCQSRKELKKLYSNH